MRMNTQNNLFSFSKVATHPFNLVSINIRRIHLHRRRKIEDDRTFNRRLPYFFNCLAHFQRKIHLCSCKAFRRIFQPEITVKILGTFLDHSGSLNGNLLNLFPVHVEYHISLKCGCGIINMEDNILDTFDSFKGFINQMLTALTQNLHTYIIRNHLAVYQCPQKIIFQLGCGRKTNLNFLESQLYEQVKEFQLFFNHHRFDQRLITIPQIHAAPDWSFLNLFIRPLTFFII